MKRYPTLSMLFMVPVLATAAAHAQSSALPPLQSSQSSPGVSQQGSTSSTRPRTVTPVRQQQQPQEMQSPAPSQRPEQAQQAQPRAQQPPVAGATSTSAAPSGPSQSASTPQSVPVTSALPPDARADMGATLAQASQISALKARARILEAQRLLKSRPAQTALTTPGFYSVTLAALDPQTSLVHLLTLPKETFLTKGAEVPLVTSLGSQVRLRILRANGVNTAVTIFDSTGRSLTPLVVEFPIERNGAFREMAYYTSAHPALLSPDVVKAGQTYVRTMLDLAAKRLRDKGFTIAPNIVDEAERLCVVEHVDHDRFRRENRIALYEEIYALYALNELDTYRYSVSVAGAGGMVQMIPWTYQMIRQRHPSVGLNPDFVTGMRNHGNALEAMLLYMQDTWNDLAQDPAVTDALLSRTATQAELMAAGYNSNPARLGGYLRRGGDAWKTLIPRETQMYLQIYRTVESLIPMKPRS